MKRFKKCLLAFLLCFSLIGVVNIVYNPIEVYAGLDDDIEARPPVGNNAGVSNGTVIPIPVRNSGGYPYQWHVVGQSTMAVRAYIVDLGSVSVIENINSDTPKPAGHCADKLSGTDGIRTKYIYSSYNWDNVTSNLSANYIGTNGNNVHVKRGGTWVSIEDSPNDVWVSNSQFRSLFGITSGGALEDLALKGYDESEAGGYYDKATWSGDDMKDLLVRVFGETNPERFDYENSVLVIEPMMIVMENLYSKANWSEANSAYQAALAAGEIPDGTDASDWRDEYTNTHIMYRGADFDNANILVTTESISAGPYGSVNQERLAFAISFQDWACEKHYDLSNLQHILKRGYSIAAKNLINLTDGIHQSQIRQINVLPFIENGVNTGFVCYGPPIRKLEQPTVALNTILKYNGEPNTTNGSYQVTTTLNKMDSSDALGVVYWDKTTNTWKSATSIEECYNISAFDLTDTTIGLAGINVLKFPKADAVKYKESNFKKFNNSIGSSPNLSHTITWKTLLANDVEVYADEQHGSAYKVNALNGEKDMSFVSNSLANSTSMGFGVSVTLERTGQSYGSLITEDENIPFNVNAVWEKAASEFLYAEDPLDTSKATMRVGHGIELLVKHKEITSTLYVIDADSGSLVETTPQTYKSDTFYGFTLPSDAKAYAVVTADSTVNISGICNTARGKDRASDLYSAIMSGIDGSARQSGGTSVPNTIATGMHPTKRCGYIIICIKPASPTITPLPSVTTVPLQDFELNHVHDNIISYSASLAGSSNYYWMLNSNRYSRTSSISSTCSWSSPLCCYGCGPSNSICCGFSASWISDYNKNYKVKYKDVSSGMVISYDSGSNLGKYLLRGSQAYGNFLRKNYTKDFQVVHDTRNLISESYRLDYAFNFVRGCINDVRVISSISNYNNINQVLRTGYGDRPNTPCTVSGKRSSYAYVNNYGSYTSEEHITLKSKFVETDRDFGFYVCLAVPVNGVCEIDDADDGEPAHLKDSGPHGRAGHTQSHSHDCGGTCQHKESNHAYDVNCGNWHCDGNHYIDCPGNHPMSCPGHYSSCTGHSYPCPGHYSSCPGHAGVCNCTADEDGNINCPGHPTTYCGRLHVSYCGSNHTSYCSSPHVSYCGNTHYYNCGSKHWTGHVASCYCPSNHYNPTCVEACYCHYSHTRTHTCETTIEEGGHIIAGYHRWGTLGYTTSFGGSNTVQDHKFYTKAYKYATDEIPGSSIGKNINVVGIKGLGITVGAQKATNGGVSKNASGVAVKGYRYAYVLKHDGSNDTSSLILKFYPEVPMLYCLQSGLSYNAHEASNWIKVNTMGEVLRKSQPSTLFLYRLRGVGNEVTGVTYSDSMQGGSAILGGGTKPIIPAGADVSLVARPTGITMDLYGYSLDIINKSTDNTTMVGSNIHYNTVVKSGANVYTDWGNGGTGTALFNDFKKWWTKMTDVTNYEADIMLKVTGSGTNKTYNNFSSVISDIIKVEPSKAGVYPIQVKNGAIVESSLGFNALINQIAKDYVCENPLTVTSTDYNTARSIFYASGLHTSILEAIESSNDSFNNSQPLPSSYGEALGNSSHWYDEETKTFVIRRFVSEGNKFSDITLNDKIDFGAAADNSFAYDNNYKEQSYNNGQWFVSIYLRNSINNLTPTYKPDNKATTVENARNNYSLLFHEVLVKSADFSIPSSTTGEFGN